jgi:DNA-binding NarL/FixJ family response regulator
MKIKNPSPASVSPSAPWRVLLADDHPLVQTGINAALAGYSELTVVGMAENGAEVLVKTRELTPDLLVLDLEMPGLPGLQVLPLVKKAHPKLRVLILSCHDDPRTIQQTMKLGADGFVPKDAPTSELITAIRALRANQSHVTPGLQSRLNCLSSESGNLTDKLTVRERQILGLIAAGLSNKEIAKKIGLSTRTIESHRLNLSRKLGIRGIADLVTFAIQNGLVSSPRKPLAPGEVEPV